MRDTATVLNDYLRATYGITLERAIADATAGVVSLALRRGHALSGVVHVACDPVGRHAYEDDGLSEQWQGVISCDGVLYRFACTTFTDVGGDRYVETIGELEAVEWGVALAMPS